MSFDPRSLFPDDEDDAQLFPRLPPITSGAPLRPEPLEPSAQKDEDNLPGLRFANAESRLQNQTASAAHKDAQPLPAYINPADLRNGPRNRDFLQLPALPTASTTGTSASASRLTIPVLNDLHQPPPSAALFPRITENENKRHAKRLPSPKKDAAKSTSPQETTTVHSEHSTTKFSKKKRSRSGSQRRQAGSWNAAEKDDLIKGVLKHGTGNWKSILADTDFRFQVNRTYLELKEMYKLYKTKNRSEETTSKDEQHPAKASTKDGTESQNEANRKARLHEKDHTKARVPNKSERPSGLQFEVSTAKDFEAHEIPRDKSDYTRIPRFARWTPDEDNRLESGFRKHGFSWSAISADSDIGLSHRSAAQIRDRFRIKYPANYKENSSAIPATKPVKISGGDTPENTLPTRDEASSAPIGALLTPDVQEAGEAVDEQGVALPPLDKNLLQTARPQNTSGPTSSANPKKPDRIANSLNEVSNWLNQLEDATMNSGDETTQDLTVYEDLVPGSQLAPLRFPYDQEWVDEGFDSSLQLPPMMSFFQDTEDP